jgi:ketosteroid isomerase-like protein
MASTMSTSDPLTLAREYLQAIEQGATGERLARFFTPDVVLEEFPNRLTPNGARRDLEQAKAAAVRGQAILAWQRYELLNSVVQGDWVALEVQWSAELRQKVPGLPEGEMRARFGVFIQFRDGKIAAQRNYDCFEPW